MINKDIKTLNKYKDYASTLKGMKSPFKKINRVEKNKKGKKPFVKLSVTKLVFAFILKSGLQPEIDDMVASLEKEIADILVLEIGSGEGDDTSLMAVHLVVRDEDVPNALVAISNYMYGNPEAKLEHLELETGSALRNTETQER